MAAEATLATAAPRFATPRTDRPTYGGEVAKLARLLGFRPMSHQGLFWDVALEHKDGVLAYREIGWTIPRQCGKINGPDPADAVAVPALARAGGPLRRADRNGRPGEARRRLVAAAGALAPGRGAELPPAVRARGADLRERLPAGPDRVNREVGPRLDARHGGAGRELGASRPPAGAELPARDGHQEQRADVRRVHGRHRAAEPVPVGEGAGRPPGRRGRRHGGDGLSGVERRSGR